MFKNYFKIAWRNLIKNKLHSFINISGLSVALSVALLIGLWMKDELSFDKNHKQYDRIAQVMQNVSLNGQVQTWTSVPYPLGDELRKGYGNDFKYVVISSQTETHVLLSGEKKFTKEGNYIEDPELLSLKMVQGTARLKNVNSILLSESLAKAFFGNTDPLDKIIKIDDNDQDVKVTGVYEDLPDNSTFSRVKYIAPWELKLNFDTWIKEMKNPWGTSAFQVFVQLADKADVNKVSAKIRDIKLNKINKDEARYKPQLFLQPMVKWHLYSEFKNGVNVGGRIQYVWLFGIIGVFILLLACINFMNLSTARSEKRSREVGIRKAIGSSRRQLISQFFSESLLTAMFAFFFSLLLAQLALPFFNEVADKKMDIPWSSPLFWLSGIGFCIITGLIAGSYPALYLSSFQPVKVLKGIFNAGSFATIPRKVLVVLQFTTSVILTIGTIIVFKQIQFAKNRSIGYSRDGLVMIHLIMPGIHSHFEAIRNELKNVRAVEEMAEAESPLTAVWRTYGDFDWKGKDPGLAVDFPNTGVSQEFGKTVGWQFVVGRDFSNEFPGDDSSSFVLNESAVNYMGLKDPVGEIIKWNGRSFKVIGVIKDMIIESPYAPVRPSIFCTAKSHDNFAVIKINPAISADDALSKIQTTFKKYSPALPFDYTFADSEYAKKFSDEERIGKLASFFAVLAIFICCLGLFGMASFLAERRTKEIGVRKVLGASVFNVWALLSKEFLILIAMSLLIAVPAAYYFMYNWLQNYSYRTELSWWIFAAACIGAFLITLLTVSFQAIKAAIANPVKSLRTE